MHSSLQKVFEQHHHLVDSFHTCQHKNEFTLMDNCLSMSCKVFTFFPSKVTTFKLIAMHHSKTYYGTQTNV